MSQSNIQRVNRSHGSEAARRVECVGPELCVGQCSFFLLLPVFSMETLVLRTNCENVDVRIRSESAVSVTCVRFLTCCVTIFTHYDGVS